ncbi:MAG: T9SS type A sorting domain-containing protein, partial [Bacteroidota bacterium]
SAIEKITMDDVSVFPNPAVSELNLTLKGRQADRVRMFSVDGKLVSEIKLPHNNRIAIETLVKGVYIAEVTVGEATQRIRWVKM